MPFIEYHFIDLTKEQKHARRIALDAAASTAQWSALVPLLAFAGYRLLRYALRVGQHGAAAAEDPADSPADVPSSPYVKAGARFTSRFRGGSIAHRAAVSWRQASWWAGEPVRLFGASWGTRAGWLVGGNWLVWLLFCCFVGTGEDYMHLTKRFGIVAASQLPLHYLLAIKSPYSPIQLITRLSHEELNAGHRILGRIILCLLSCHASFYLNFFVRSGFLAKRIKDRDVIVGITAISLFSILGTTALGVLRKWNYRIFYITHISLASLLLPLLYFHVHHIRLFIFETSLVFAVHGALRFFNSRRYEGRVSVIPDTDLIEVRIPLSSGDRARKWLPGSHVYLSLPTRGSTSVAMKTLKERLWTNPFTIASLPGRDKELLLIARTYSGNTLKLAQLAHQESIFTSLAIEGPYGAAFHLPDLNAFDRVLIVAGGSGASFAVPLWRSMLSKQPRSRFVWAVRSLPEAAWIQPYLSGDDGFMDAEKIEIHVTRGGGAVPRVTDGGAIELEERERLMGDAAKGDGIDGLDGLDIRNGRPDLSQIVDETIAGSGGQVAVLACGPEAMIRQLRKDVGGWISSGREVFWHAESFGL